MRFLTIIFAGLLAIVSVGATQAAVPDNGPPYTDEQFLALAPLRLPAEFQNPVRVREWWGRAPDYLRKHMLNSKSTMWWPIILCNYMGFRPDTTGELNSAKCERDSFEASQRGKSMWTADGQWVGPSEECKKRDKRTKWGELICD